MKKNWDKISLMLNLKCNSVFNIKYLFFSFFLLLTTYYSYAQTATASTKQKEYVIGDWIPVDLFVSAASNSKVVFPALKDSISPVIEIANFTGIDTVKKSGQYEFHQLVNLIAFDTGQIWLPQFQFLVDNSGKLDTIISEAILIHVAGVKIDTTQDIKDIKAPLKIPLTFKEILPYLLGFLALAIIAAIIVWFIVRRKKKNTPQDEKYLLPPHVWALKELDKLQQDKLWQTGEIKHYYSRLTDIARTYIELRYKVPAMEQTTEELMKSMHKGIIKQTLKKELNEILVLSDFVKFAKAQPDFMENEQALKVIKDFINKTKQIEEEKKLADNKKNQ